MRISCKVVCMRLAVSSALEPVSWYMASDTAGIPFRYDSSA